MKQVEVPGRRKIGKTREYISVCGERGNGVTMGNRDDAAERVRVIY